MPSEIRSPRLAVLIDADNASARIVDGLFEEIAKIGEASVRRIYGDFSHPRSRRGRIRCRSTPSYHNSSLPTRQARMRPTSRLVIDAMDLLHSGRFDGFCLVSSDSDFTRLAARIREQGVDVFGFGDRRRRRASVRPAADLCTPRTCFQTPRTVRLALQSLFSHSSQRCRSSTKSLRRWKVTMDGCPWEKSEDSSPTWHPISIPRNFGFRKLSDLVRKTDAFDIDHPKGRADANSHEASQ